MRDGRWHTETPPTGVVVEVWYMTSVILATFDGQVWRTTEGAKLSDITHWRAK